MEKRKGDWMETYTGKFYPIDPKSNEVNFSYIYFIISSFDNFPVLIKHFLIPRSDPGPTIVNSFSLKSTVSL